jgi:predicted transcriptional regulator
MEELQPLMLQWTKVDKELKELNKQASILRKQKEELQDRLGPIIQDNHLEDNIFSIPSLQTNVTFKEHKTSESMSYKFLEEKFKSYFTTIDECGKLLQYIKDNRKKETSFALKSSLLKSNEY